MATPNNKILRWTFWALLAIFLAVTVIIDRHLFRPDHWSSSFLYVIPIWLAQICTSFILRRFGLSPKAHPLEMWPNEHYSEAVSTNLEYEIRFPKSMLWFCGAMSAFLVVILLYVYLFVPPSQQIGRELAVPLICVFALMGVYLCSYFSKAVIRVDSHGISGAYSQPIAWGDITACRYEEQHDAYGAVTNYNIVVLGRMERVLATYIISSTPVEQRVRLCETLRQILTKS